MHAATNFPALANWATYAAPSDKHYSYDTTQDGIKYSIDPVLTPNGKLRGYSLTCFGWPGMSGHANVLSSPMGHVSVHSFIGKKPSFVRAALAAKAAREAHKVITLRQQQAAPAATPPTAVVFRTFPTGEIIALFPYEIATGYLVQSYQHVGQHGGASLELIATTRPATAEEVAPLAQELTAPPYGYNLAPIKRINYAKFRDAVTAAKRY